ncbi:MAG TPA: RcnB family protein [Steroidobacteraceae bacterium]|jgi:Ni/Co efflux regulator RcnB|nr:RcnB family protein [Steroidobacteraceae bacterium]
MRSKLMMGAAFVSAFLMVGLAPAADQEQEHDRPAPHAAMKGQPHAQPGNAHHAPQGEPYPGPKRYARVTEPKGWNTRPATADRGTYQHNFRATRSFHIGPYHRPRGWTAHSWAYGQILPRAYFAPEYRLSDYWLFSLEVPPAGYEWVRDGDDALLVDIDSGEILQVEYGVFT